MGEDCRSWFPQQQFGWQLPLPNLNYSGAPMQLGQQNTVPAILNPGTNMVLTNGTLPINSYAELPLAQVGQTNEPHGWFYCMPRYRQAFTPSLNSKEQLPAGPYGNCREIAKPKAGSECAQKQFLVFDQSGDQTTMIFSPGIGTPVRCLTSWSPMPLGAYDFREDPRAKGEVNLYSGPSLIDELNETNGTDLHSEMHEDTEELNALLYSDDDSDYTDDDEVTSTGHSPGTMTAHEKQDWFEGGTEEVATSAGPTKKRKRFDRDYDDILSPMVTARSMKFYPHLNIEDDAESSCANGQNPGSGDVSSNKRIRKDKIRETVNVLRSILPDGKGKDSMVVLDEAIDYLKSLKLKAKAFGLDGL